MCGIIGLFNNSRAGYKIIKGLEILKNRGKDGYGITDGKGSYYSKDIRKLTLLKSRNVLGHSLHSVVGYVRQPIRNCFVANCEIYNWKQLRDEYASKAENDAELMLELLEKNSIKAIEEFDGVFAFCYWNKEELVLARDILGEKPIWYSHSDGFGFASEKKALERLGYLDIVELNPRKILKYDIKEDRIEFVQREFFSTTPELRLGMKELETQLKKRLIKAIRKRIPKRKFGLLFSGGIDSTVTAFILKQLGCKFVCYTAACSQGKTAEDLVYSEKVAKELGLRLKKIEIELDKVPSLLKEVVPLIEDTNVTKVAVALPFFVACERAKKDGCKVIFSGLGSEEIFAGYQRHKNSADINKECLSGLIKIYERDLYRDDVITMFHSLELRLPFLDKSLVDFCLRIPVEYKLKEGRDKIILRNVAKALGIPEKFCERKKRAAQYGSNFMKAIEKLTKTSRLRYKSEYLRRFYPSHNLKLAVLFSGGKDSCYAIHVMQRQNYEISCLVAIKSKNPDSWMFHTPNIEMTRMQAEAMGLPLIETETLGKKEEELKDLRQALVEAKKQYKIEGVVTGALYSTYQRNRIEKICDELGLKIFSPLWHVNQETEMREMINEGFVFIITKIAADGLSKSWLGRQVTQKDVDDLVALNKKNGINIAFEGGEAETLMLDGPIFKKKLEIRKAENRMENSYTGVYEIKEISLS